LTAIWATRRWDLVLVNILAPVIIALLARSRLADYLAEDGRLILSGIIEEQEADVGTALEAASLVVTDRMAIRDWVCLAAQKEKAPPVKG
jgi:ribosomal protein L11 methylase PrmA